MAHHINRQYKTGACEAADPKNCPFWGIHEGTNHYETEAEAETVSRRLMDVRYGLLSRSGKSFEWRRDIIANSFVSFGLAPSRDALPEPNGSDQMVEMWFGGSKKRHDLFVNVLRTSLPEATKREWAILVMRGMDTKPVNATIDFDSSPGRDSEVSIISDDFDMAEFLENLGEGR